MTTHRETVRSLLIEYYLQEMWEHRSHQCADQDMIAFFSAGLRRAAIDPPRNCGQAKDLFIRAPSQDLGRLLHPWVGVGRNAVGYSSIQIGRGNLDQGHSVLRV